MSWRGVGGAQKEMAKTSVMTLRRAWGNWGFAPPMIFPTSTFVSLDCWLFVFLASVDGPADTAD